MSVSGTGPVNSGSPFKTFPRSPLKATGAGVALSEKITKALSDQQNDFARMEALELKKRLAFYERFGGTADGVKGIVGVASQTSFMLSRLNGGGKGVLV